MTPLLAWKERFGGVGGGGGFVWGSGGIGTRGWGIGIHSRTHWGDIGWQATQGAF